MPLSILSEFLGHASEETTRIYAYADTEMKRKAIEKATPRNIPGDETPIWDTSDDEVLRKLAGLYWYSPKSRQTPPDVLRGVCFFDNP